MGGAKRVVVEFVGPAGSGKSTLLRAVEERLREHGASGWSYSASGWRSVDGRRLRGHARLRHQVASIVRQPSLAAWSIANVGGKRRLNRLLTMVRRADLAKAAARRNDGVLLLDEGPWRVVPRMLGEGVRFSAWLFRSLPWPDFFVLVTVDPDVAVERHYVRRAGLEEIRGAAVMRQNHEDQLRGLSPVIARRSHITVDTTGGDDQAVVVAARIMQWAPNSADE
jgi:hypothetical protein